MSGRRRLPPYYGRYSSKTDKEFDKQYNYEMDGSKKTRFHLDSLPDRKYVPDIVKIMADENSVPPPAADALGGHHQPTRTGTRTRWRPSSSTPLPPTRSCATARRRASSRCRSRARARGSTWRPTRRCPSRGSAARSPQHAPVSRLDGTSGENGALTWGTVPVILALVLARCNDV